MIKAKIAIYHRCHPNCIENVGKNVNPTIIGLENFTVFSSKDGKFLGSFNTAAPAIFDAFSIVGMSNCRFTAKFKGTTAAPMVTYKVISQNGAKCTIRQVEKGKAVVTYQQN